MPNDAQMQADIQAVAELVHQEIGEALKRVAARIRVAEIDQRMPWPIARQVMVQVARAMIDGLAATPDDVPPYENLKPEEQQVAHDIQQLSRHYRLGEGGA